MPARSPYIPRRHVAFNNWANQFAKTVAADAARFALEPAAAQEIAAVVADWNAAFQPVTAKGTKTRCTVAAKNEALRDALKTLRGYAQQVAHSQGVSPSDKLVLGVNPGDREWTHIQPPASWPVLHILRAAELQLTIRNFDRAAVKKAQAKPYGVGFCQIFYSLRPLAAGRITDRRELSQQVTATRSPVILDFPSSRRRPAVLSGRLLAAAQRQARPLGADHVVHRADRRVNGRRAEAA